jgi:hypothetical protein
LPLQSLCPVGLMMHGFQSSILLEWFEES